MIGNILAAASMKAAPDGGLEEGLKNGTLYMGADGLAHCSKCGKPREGAVSTLEHEFIKSITSWRPGPNHTMIHWQLCDCDLKRKEEPPVNDYSLLRQKKWRYIQDSTLRRHTFESAVDTRELAIAKRYVDRWEYVRTYRHGLLFWGPPGFGKTFLAACIANAIYDKGVIGAVISLPRFVNEGFEKLDIIDDLKANCGLLVLDDLGAERQTSAALEAVELIVDEWYKTGRPLITTTNISLEDLKSPQDMTYHRIYGRVLEMCNTPILVESKNFRERISEEKKALKGGDTA